MKNELDRTKDSEITLRDRSRNDRFKNGKHAGHMRIQEKERESGFGGVTVGLEIDRDRRSKVRDQEEHVEERSGLHVSPLPSSVECRFSAAIDALLSLICTGGYGGPGRAAQLSQPR